MKALIDVLCWVVGLAGIGYAIWQFVLFVQSPGATGNSTYLWHALAGAIVACIGILGYFLRNVNKEEEIHITQ